MAFLNSANLPEMIADYIANKIIKMEYKPGDRIVELKIAKELKVSHSPIREALRMLEKSRLVEHVPRKGAYVTDLDEASVESMVEIFTELLVLVAKKTIRNADGNDIKKINNIIVNAIAPAAQNDKDEYYNSVVEFAFACLESANDKLLTQIIFELIPSIRRLLYLSLTFHEAGLTENAALLCDGGKALNDRNVKKAERVLRKWLAIQKDNTLKGLKEGEFF